jgi:hypothetical protein
MAQGHACNAEHPLIRRQHLQRVLSEIWNLFSLPSLVACCWDCFLRFRIINLANLIFGAWILAGGALTAHLVSKQRPSGISYGDGAFGGVLSGFFGAVVSTIMLIPSKLFFASDWETVRQQAEQQLAKTPETAGPMRDLLLRAMSAEVSFTTEMFWFFFYGFSFSLFAMLGGMLMVWISNRRRKKRISV